MSCIITLKLGKHGEEYLQALTNPGSLTRPPRWGLRDDPCRSEYWKAIMGVIKFLGQNLKSKAPLFKRAHGTSHGSKFVTDRILEINLKCENDWNSETPHPTAGLIKNSEIAKKRTELRKKWG